MSYYPDAGTVAVGHGHDQVAGDLDHEAMADDALARAVVGDDALGLILVEEGVLIPALAVTTAAANDAVGAFRERLVRANLSAPQDSNPKR